jgi:F-type H+-transporting ATPase subunit a
MLFKTFSRNTATVKALSNFIEQELKATLRNHNIKGKLNILLTFFVRILILNMFGLIPFVFTITAHMLITFCSAFPLWFGIVLFRVTKNNTHFLRHLVPIRTPLPLSQFIVLIERVRQIIRPITLAVRLAANITAGHILIALSRSTTTIINPLSLVLLILFFLEIAVAAIQRYVFTILITMYLEEAYDKPKPPLPYSLPKPMTPFHRNNHPIHPSNNN